MKTQEPATTIQAHTLPRPLGLIECDVVLDVGAGIRPMQWYKPERHICVEPYAPYCKILEAAGYEVWEDTAQWVLTKEGMQVDAVYLLDVIEHMEKEIALSVLRWACKVARVQVVVYTPYGFMKQTEDAWGLGGHSWQTHRSGWLPDEFPKWRTELFNPGVRQKSRPATDPSVAQGFYASWEPNNSE